MWRRIAVPVLAALLLSTPAIVGASSSADAEEDAQLRVCADPNNLPYSNQQLEGFENRIAALIGSELGRPVSYTWWPQRRGFLRNTLKAGKCDLVIGVPAGYDPVLTTESYYRSSYVFLYPKSADYDLSSLDDAALRKLRIGVHLIGDDYTNSPPAHVLGAKGIVQNVIGYSIFGDYGQPSPPRKLIDAVGAGEVDVAIAWGPIAGYFAQQQPEPMVLVPVPTDPAQSHLPFSYAIAMGVRRSDPEFHKQLDEILTLRASEIQVILREYGIPTLSP